MTGKLRQAAAKAGKPDFVALWADKLHRFPRAARCQLVAKLAAETVESIQNLKGVLHAS